MSKKKKNSNYVTEKRIKAKEDKIKAQKAQRVKKIAITSTSIVLAVAFLVVGIILIFSGTPDKTVTHHASIKIKDYGTLHVELYGNEAPETVANFVKLANEGYYNGLDFFRVMDGFMIQGGQPKEDGKKPASIKGEFKLNGFKNLLKHERGTISMARANDYNSASGQFFIVHKTSENNTKSLDGNYAAFGMVTDGMEYVDKIVEDMKKLGYSEYVAKDEHKPVIESISIHASH